MMKLQKAPLATSGLILGLLGLGESLERHFSYFKRHLWHLSYFNLASLVIQYVS